MATPTTVLTSPFDLSTLADPLYGFSPDDRELLRRCASVRICDDGVFHQVMRAGLDDAMDFRELDKLYFVERLPGAGYRYRLRGSTRNEIFNTWWDEPSQAQDAIPERLQALSRRLVDYYRVQGDDQERLYHLALVDEAAAIALLESLFDRADQQFDLAQCSAILRTLEERPNRLLGPDLRRAFTLKRVRLDTRSLWAAEYRETIPYVERNETRDLLDQLVADPQHWILNIHAPGGMGKSMFIRATIARRCVLEDIPVARIDFDFLPYMANVAREPWRILLSIAQQLTRQRPDNPFQELLTQYAPFVAEAGSRPIVSPQPFAGSDLSDAEKAMLRSEVLSRFTGTLVEVTTPVVLIFDTMENLLHRDVDLKELFGLLQDVHERCAQVRVIMAGRLDLSRPVPQVGNGADDRQETEFARRFGGQNIPVQLKGFDEDEAHTYLVAKRGLDATDPRVPVMIEKARIQDGDHGREGISPFKLALLADIVRVHPQIKAEEFDRYEDVDLAHLVERVVDRIQDDRVKWLVRYGIVPRLLTRAVVQEVLIPFMVAGMQGQSEHDDAAQDPAVEPQLDESPFPQVGEGPLEVDVDALWSTLYRYTAEYSWVFADEAVDALRFHPDVVEPVRRLLRKHLLAGRPILLDLHRACATYYEKQAGLEPGKRPQWLQEAAYHKLQSEDPDADAYWLRLVDEAAGDNATVAALAEEALREPLVFDETSRREAAAMPRFGDCVLARAHFELAGSILKDREVLTESDLDRMDRHLAQAEQLNAASGTSIPAAKLAYLRARSALAHGQRQEALEVCQQALEHPADSSNELDLRGLYGETLRSLDRPGAAEQYAQAAVLAGEVQPERLDDITRRQIDALDAEERFEEAAQVCAAWREGMGPDSAVDLVGESLLTHMRQYLAMGQERRAAEVGQAGLDAWLSASTGRLGELGSWPSRVQAEVMLARLQPALALRELERESGPDRKSRSRRAEQPFETELRARIAAALVDPLQAKPAMESLAFSVYGPQSKQVVHWLLAYSRLNVDETGNLREAGEYLARAQDSSRDPESSARCGLQGVRLLARQGKSDKARAAAQALAARDDLPPWPGLRLQVALEAAIQDGGREAWQALLAALEPVAPATRRLLLLDELWRCPASQDLAAGTGDALLAMLPDPGTDGLDPALGAVRLAEVMRVAGRAGDARRLLGEAEAACRDPLRLAVLRQVYLARDRLGWEQDSPDPGGLDFLADTAWDGSPELGGLTLLEHAERLVLVAHDPDRAAELLDRAEIMLKSAARVWAGRVAAAQARIAALRGDPDQAQDYLERARKNFYTLDDEASAEALADWVRQALAPDQEPEDAGESVAESMVTSKSANGPDVPDQGPLRLDVQLSLAGRDWHVEFRRSDGPEWADDVTLDAEFSSLLDFGPQDAASRRFLEEFQTDWRRVGLQMGRHLFPEAARSLLVDGDRPLDLRLKIRAMNYGWMPWELLRLDEDSPPLAVDGRLQTLYRYIEGPAMRESGASPGTGVLIVRMARAEDDLGTRSGSPSAGADPTWQYRQAGVASDELVQPELWELQDTLNKLRPAVIHLVSNLVENGPQAELVFGSRGGNVGGDRFSKSYYMSNVVDTLSVSQLGGILSAQEPSPLIVLDVPAPPAGSERLRQLFLRNAFAAEWSAYAHALPAAVLATGLGDSRQQERLIESLANLLREERSIGEIAVELRGQVAAQDLGSRGLRSGGLRGLTDLLPFAGTALFTDRPERVFPMGRQVKS